MIYQKSALGIQEIFSSNRSLNTRQRQVLVLVDGKRSAEELEGFFEKKQLREILTDLDELGFIQSLDATGAPPLPTHNYATNALSETRIILAPQEMGAIKQILLNGADDYMGILGRSLKQKIEEATEFKKLRNYISLWHMALRESKLGRASADVLMGQINSIIEDGVMIELEPIL